MDAHNAAHWKERVAKEHHSAHAAHALPHANPMNLLSHMKTRTLVAEPNNTPTPYWSKARASTAWEQYQTGYNPISGYPIRWKSAKPGSFQPTADAPFSSHRKASMATIHYPADDRYMGAEMVTRARQPLFDGSARLADTPPASACSSPRASALQSTGRSQRLPTPTAESPKVFKKYLEQQIRTCHLLPRQGTTWGP